MSGRRAFEAVAISFLATNIGNFPAFSIGALGPELKADLGLTEFHVGALVSGFYVLSAACSYPSGLLVTRWGWSRALAVMGIVIAVAGMAFAVPSGTATLLIAGMALAGAANSLAQPAANEVLLAHVPSRRQGLALGIKQTSGPAGTVVAGLSLLVLVPHFGWRATLYFLIPLGLVLAVWVRRSTLRRTRELAVSATDPTTAQPVRAWSSASLLILCASTGLGAAVSNGVATFYVLDAVASGVGLTVAGALLAAASVISVVTRLLSGFLADRRSGGHLRTAATMMLIGMIGLVVLACAGDSVTPFAVGALLALGIGWGWNGLLQLGTMALYRHAAAHVTGLLQTFVFGGAVVGPLWVGAMAEAFGFEVAWISAALAMGLGFAGIGLFRYRVRRYGL